MKLRRRNGAVLGLVAACMLAVVVLGIGLFFLTKMFGGGREVAHATDSGILNVAKQELDNPTVNVVGTDFEYCGTPLQSKAISLYSYNKCVGQTLLVALNSVVSATPTAGSHATALFGVLRDSVEKPLHQALTNGGNGSFNYQTAFTNLANSNNTRMSGNNPVQAPGYKAAYMMGGTSKSSVVASSNLYFNKNSLVSSLLSQLPLNLNGTFKPPNYPQTTDYVQGYKGISIPVPGGAALTLMTVPVFPSQTPHLVSLGDFNACTNPPAGDPNILPNAVRINSQALDSTSNSLTGSVACAIVGSVDVGYTASFPAGYIEIFNRPGTTLTNPNGGPWIAPVDNSNNIFNNEMFGAPGVSVSPASVNGSAGAVFSCAYPGATTNPASPTNLVDQWVAYNTAAAAAAANPLANPPIAVPAMPPTSGGGGQNNGLDDGIYFSSDPHIAGTLVTNVSTLKTLTTNSRCLNQVQTTGYVQGDCLKWMGSAATTYGRSMPSSSGGEDLSTVGPIFSNVDYIKMVVIQEFQNRVQSFTTNAPATPTFPDNPSMNGSTGMGVYTDVSNPNAVTGLSMTYPTPQNTLPIMKPMSPWSYLQQIDAWQTSGGCGTTAGLPTSILAQVTQRCQQIQPSVTSAQVQALLASNKQFGMGVKFYIYLPHGDSSNTSGPYGGLVMDAGGSASANGGPVGYNASNPAVPDGPPVSPLVHCQGTYQLIGRMINVPRNPEAGYPDPGPAPVSQGDLNVHAQPYTKNGAVGASGSLTGVDHALWQESSGYGNLLGHLEFANTVLGGNAFSAPN